MVLHIAHNDKNVGSNPTKLKKVNSTIKFEGADLALEKVNSKLSIKKFNFY